MPERSTPTLHAWQSVRGSRHSTYRVAASLPNSLGIPDLGISTMEGCPHRRRTHCRCDGLASSGGYRYGMGWSVQHRTHHPLDGESWRGGGPHRGPGSRQTLRHRPGKEIVPAEEMVDRVKAAVDARTDREFVVMARTDALASEGLNAAIERSAAYVAAGADMIFAEAVTEISMLQKFKEAVRVPILANITEFGRRRCIQRTNSPPRR